MIYKFKTSGLLISIAEKIRIVALKPRPISSAIDLVDYRGGVKSKRWGCFYFTMPDIGVQPRSCTSSRVFLMNYSSAPTSTTLNHQSQDFY